jgi:NAD(P)H-hydrate epimerase
MRTTIVSKFAKKHECTIVVKGEKTLVTNGDESVLVEGGNAGLTKGGTGDVQAGLTAALFAKNEAFLAACAAAQVIKSAADDLYAEQNVYFNADDVAAQIPQTLAALIH